MQGGTFLPASMIAALFSFTFVSSITPGPNNIMLAISGVNFGVRRTLPHMAGITSGLLIIIILTGLGLGTLFTAFPILRQVMQVLGILYTLWLAWKIATAGSLGGGDMPHPMRYGAAFAFQWINIKLWMMAIATAALYVRPGHAGADTALITAVVASINVPVMFFWAGFGAGLRDMLKIPARIRLFNLVMGLALAASVLALLRM
jgi:threonine/homoserine/homoserine lactone efflux protein